MRRATKALTLKALADIEGYMKKVGIRDERRDEVRWELAKHQAELEGLRRRAGAVERQDTPGG